MDQDTDPRQIAAGLSQLCGFLRSSQWRLGESLGLTPTQMNALAAVAEHGPLRVTALAKRLGVTQPTMSDVVSALEDKGLAARRPDPSDGRATGIAATRAGEAMASRQEPPDSLANAIASLGAAERAGLKLALTKIIRNLQQDGAIAPQRHCLTCRFFRPYAHPDAVRPHHCAFVDAAFGDAALRLDCSDHVEAEPDTQERTWTRFLQEDSAG
jgi:DNA-binding MarR family transcriptional regulator